MPELPEVETMRRGVLPIVGGRVRDVAAPRSRRLKRIRIAPRLDALRRRLVGRRVADIGRAGKRVLVVFDGGDRLALEPRMTGLALLADPPDEEHVRFRLELDDSPAGALLFWDRRGLGSVRLMSPREFEAQLGPERLGPDALSVSAEALRERLSHSRRAIKVALLDQRSLAGVGNLYASEMLHVAGIDPRRPCRELRPADWRRLRAAMAQVLEEAILHEGSTLSDGTYRNALNLAGGYQNLHRVYDRSGELCRNCSRGRIERIVQSQRSTFFCPRCQRPPHRRVARP